MNYRMIGRLISQILAVEGLFMIPALLLCMYDGDMHAALAFAVSLGAIAAAAGGMYLFCRRAKKGFYAREGLVCVGLSWIAMSIFGCLPFYLSREIPHFVDALFEIVSGFTTTGASILPDVESLSRGLIYWRSFSHWLGAWVYWYFCWQYQRLADGTAVLPCIF